MRWFCCKSAWSAFFHKLAALLLPHDRKFLLLLALFSIGVSVMEMVGVAAIMPFVSVATDFSLLETNHFYHYAYIKSEVSEPVDFVLLFGAVLILFYLLRSMVNLFYFHQLSKFSRGRYHGLATRLFQNYIGRSYGRFVEQNSSIMSKIIISEAFNLTNVLSALLMMMSEIFVIILIYGTLMYINWKVTLALSVLLLLNAVVLIKKVSPRIKTAGKERERYQRIFYEIMNASFGNFKMLKLRPDNTGVLEDFRQASSGFAKASITNETLVHVPRLFLEALAFIIIILIVMYYIEINESDASAVVAIVSMFVLGLYRLMPSVNRIMSAYNTVLYNIKSLELIYADLAEPTEHVGSEPLAFRSQIQFDSVSFGYRDGKPVLNNVSLTIRRGEKVAFIGESGSGKSTLVDVLMGLYCPTRGTILIDGKMLDAAHLVSWRRKIGYIPQHIYLFDGTVAENVAFDTDMDREKVRRLLQQVHLLSLLEKNHDGIETQVGENGLKLSGGQKQRIAIARALYTDPEILVLDEATSALDETTEANIMEEIYRLSETKTLIVIAHRLSTIRHCDKVYQLSGGKGILQNGLEYV